MLKFIIKSRECYVFWYVWFSVQWIVEYVML